MGETTTLVSMRVTLSRTDWPRRTISGRDHPHTPLHRRPFQPASHWNDAPRLSGTGWGCSGSVRRTQNAGRQHHQIGGDLVAPLSRMIVKRDQPPLLKRHRRIAAADGRLNRTGFPRDHERLAVSNRLPKVFDQAFGKHSLHARDQTKAPHFAGQRFPGSRIVERKLPHRHPAHRNRHPGPPCQRVLEQLFIGASQDDQLAHTAPLQREHGTLEKA